MPDIVVSMTEITVFAPLLKGRPRVCVIFPYKRSILHLNRLSQRCVENSVFRFFLFLFSKSLLTDSL
uniref:Uncharacterized protein n=1 Tax=Siphoviridae sp. cthrG7 TaxID=2826428 RepID=A0A8S5MC24_9CAUD|nr:MAG TPA: hypothetical protein [Siphoviridae sp. cthrG7]